METWTAGQLGWSNGAYAGRRVCFNTQGQDVQGTLTRSYTIPGGDMPWTHLVVDGVDHCVNNDVPVQVF